MRNQIAFPIIILLLSIGQSFAQEKDSPPLAKINFTNESNEEMIFMKSRLIQITKTNPKSAQRAKFGIAEYYFKHNDFIDAFKDFKEYTESFAADESTLLAKLYLYKIAIIRNDAELASELKKEIFDKPFILLFSKFKILKYKSVFNNNYEIHYYLDSIKVFLNGEIFEEIKP